jgi:aerobic carbon-monoxide dehydrogenase small subunit
VDPNIPLCTEQSILCTINGAKVQALVPVRQNLVDFLREKLGLTGSHVGCEHGVCGACTVRVNERAVRGCLMLAVQADGTRIETIEGLSASGEIAALQQAFITHNALQCGFCTPGMLIMAAEILREPGNKTREQIRTSLSGNYCRCTGYQTIVDAVEFVANQRET